MKKNIIEIMSQILRKYFLSRKGFCYLTLLIWFNIFMFRVILQESMYNLYIMLSLEIGMFIVLGIISFEKIEIKYKKE